MRLKSGQLPIKVVWRNAHVAPWDLAAVICQNIIYKKKTIVFNDLSSKFNPSLRRASSV